MSRMTKGQWIFLFVATGIADFVQLVIIEGIGVWLFGAGIAVNEILDPIVGVAIGGFLMWRGVPMLTRPMRLLALAGSEMAAVISAGVAQSWILSVWYIHNSVVTEEAGIRAQMESAQADRPARPRPYYENGRREARADQQPEEAIEAA